MALHCRGCEHLSKRSDERTGTVAGVSVIIEDVKVDAKAYL